MSTKATCPFCSKQFFEYALLVHIEIQHCEEEKSPFIPDEGLEEADLEEFSGLGSGSGTQKKVDEKVDEDEFTEYCECPVEDCGEMMPLNHLQNHVDMHGYEYGQHGFPEDYSEESTQPSADELTSDSDYLQTSAEHTPSSTPGPAEAALNGPGGAPYNWRKHLLTLPHRPRNQLPLQIAEGFQVKQVKRLGKKELGTYHKEESMPDWLFSLITRHKYKSSQDTIPVLAQYIQQSSKTQYAYLCNPATQHITKLRREGGFCGYRNIQMLVSYIIGTGAQGAAAFGYEIPTIFQIQDFIEDAWDRGIHPDGRIELGNLRRTRKYIGTPEASTLFQSLGIQWGYTGLKNKEGDAPTASEHRLYDYVENYFSSCPGVKTRGTVRNTTRPPLYFQHQGHSMTIIGIERTAKGTRNLLVFDPSYQDPTSITKYIGRKVDHPRAHMDDVLKFYRRGPKYLAAYQHFEVLHLK
ncbi:DUF1671-domain-containing protein [Annulohypoxylon maeteangense]|uniref:DUF1671-domain-containing protein n=1 Tax=Annulohypoxylon maeteangense TaxID=1927788 RepID=UPI00200780AD|nr:DUF1671-domain-containing protein [Annulohypoxylon maeteangense]KAI0885229.1 DUF1671-domain-containing protein [Annulohypoxylon maeteangense]